MHKGCWILGLLLSCSQVIAQPSDTTGITLVGQTVPSFSCTTLDGKTINIRKLRNHAVLINFFATWCSACNLEMPLLENEIWQKFRKTRLVVLAIGREHTKTELEKYRDEKKLTFWMAPDPQREIFQLFAKKNIPRNILIDHNGKIVYQSLGYTPEEFQQLVRIVQSVLNNK
jgi:peroxiredoxin